MFVPISVLEQWPAPDYVHPITRGTSAAIVLSIILALATAVVVIRVYTRIAISKSFGLDDTLILFAFVFALGFHISGVLGILVYGWDRHIWDVKPLSVIISLKMAIIVENAFDISTTFTKLSMVALIYRVIGTSNNIMRWVALLLAAAVAADGVIFFFVTTFQCRPVSDYWLISLVPQNCIDEAAHLISASFINTVMDLLIVLAPIPTVIGLELPRKQQIIVIALFGGGFLATIAGAVRTYTTWMMVTDPLMDRTWQSSVVVLTSGLEIYIGIICASVPATKPFFAKKLPSLLSSKNGRVSKFGQRSTFRDAQARRKQMRKSEFGTDVTENELESQQLETYTTTESLHSTQEKEPREWLGRPLSVDTTSLAAVSQFEADSPTLLIPKRPVATKAGSSITDFHTVLSPAPPPTATPSPGLLRQAIGQAPSTQSDSSSTGSSFHHAHSASMGSLNKAALNKPLPRVMTINLDGEMRPTSVATTSASTTYGYGYGEDQRTPGLHVASMMLPNAQRQREQVREVGNMPVQPQAWLRGRGGLGEKWS